MNKRRSSRGFVIAKLLPFCKAVKPPTPSKDLYNNNNNNVHYTSSTTMTTSYAPRDQSAGHFNNYVITATTTTPDLPPKVSFLQLQPISLGPEDKDIDKKLNKAIEKGFGRGIDGVDECVDARAASYISSVQERFKLDH